VRAVRTAPADQLVRRPADIREFRFTAENDPPNDVMAALYPGLRKTASHLIWFNLGSLSACIGGRPGGSGRVVVVLVVSDLDRGR
jgi:hypothetical protein